MRRTSRPARLISCTVFGLNSVAMWPPRRFITTTSSTSLWNNSGRNSAIQSERKSSAGCGSISRKLRVGVAHHRVVYGIREESVSAGRILVVDDDPQIRRVMRVTLTAHGYDVSDAKSGEEALERLHSENYDLVLLDMNMSGMGGIKVCRTLRSGRHGFELAIIMLTVRDTEKDKVDALDAGADDYV